MKKFILGLVMFASGLLSSAVLLSGTMSFNMQFDGGFSAFRALTAYQLMPVFLLFAAIAIIGFVLAVLGLRDQRK